MTTRVIAPYGTWRSTVTAERVAESGVRMSAVALDEGSVYWLEGRPAEGGRNVVVCCDATGVVSDATPAGTNVRSRVHEYGGGAYLVSRGVLYYTEFTDQRIYRLEPAGAPEALTPVSAWRYADMAVDPRQPRLVCVREDHSQDGREPTTTLVAVPLNASGEVQIVASGHDFYSTPRFSPDGKRLCWLTWDHPRMPWDGTELWAAEVSADGSLAAPVKIAGGEDESIFQPGWLADGTLVFASDRSGWWNLYRVRDGAVERIVAAEAEFGRPQWQFGMATWAPVDPHRLLAVYQSRGRWRMTVVGLRSGSAADLPTDVEPGDNIAATATHAVIVGGSAVAADAVMRIDLATGQTSVLCAASAVDLTPDAISPPEAIEFPTDRGVTAHAFYYAPRNPAAQAPPGERPPLVVVSHGGPTASASARLNLELQYWTSRGFAVVDVNYGGSSGYGREYRRRLRGTWGVVDVADCVAAATHLVARGLADGNRLLIRGRSAGGFTTLAALAFAPGVFSAGASYYGVSDLELLARETHKFEARYLDQLVGPYPAAQQIYRDRSPIHSAARVRCPVVFFHGAEDVVVPLNQAQTMANVLRKKGLETEVLVLEGEQHGFRKKESVVRCLEAELAFYREVLGV